MGTLTVTQGYLLILIVTPALTLCSMDRFCGMVDVYTDIIRVFNILTFVYLLILIVATLTSPEALAAANTSFLAKILHAKRTTFQDGRIDEGQTDQAERNEESPE